MERSDKDLAFILRYENVAWYENGAVRILDRRIYPIKTEFVICKTHCEVAQALTDMVTQSGGPYTAAGMGMALAAYECRGMKADEQIQFLKQASETIATARPTTVAKMRHYTQSALAAGEKAILAGANAVDAVFEQALKDTNDRYRSFITVGRLLASKFPQGGTVMTQCWGETIVGMMLRACRENNNDIKVICPETRPYCQGARLTASCVRDMGFDVTVISDNMPAYVMEKKKVNVFTSAADVICMDGHIVNKVGTFQIALAANYWGIPYYVTGTPNKAHEFIASVNIEERDAELVLHALDTKITLDGVKGYYPAFDITPPKLVSGVVTDKGIFSSYDLRAYWNQPLTSLTK
jgi:methylthioribose-1-phosphate isomerase